MIFVKKLNIGIFFFFYRPPLPAWITYIPVTHLYVALHAVTVIQVIQLPFPQPRGGYYLVPYPTTLLETDIDIYVFMHYIKAFLKLFFCNVGRFALLHIKSLKNLYKGKMHVPSTPLIKILEWFLKCASKPKTNIYGNKFKLKKAGDLAWKLNINWIRKHPIPNMPETNLKLKPGGKEND